MVKRIPVQLKFTCPLCGGNKLVSTEKTVEEYYILVIQDDEYEPVKYANKCEMIDHYKVKFGCVDCDFIVKNGSKEVDHEEDLVEWIKNNCPQE